MNDLIDPEGDTISIWFIIYDPQVGFVVNSGIEAEPHVIEDYSKPRPMFVIELFTIKNGIEYWILGISKVPPPKSKLSKALLRGLANSGYPYFLIINDIVRCLAAEEDVQEYMLDWGNSLEPNESIQGILWQIDTLIMHID